MDDNNISEILKALAKGKNRSATARLREIFEEIEVALRSGVRRKDVHQVLVENGFAISFASFELAIYRIRKAKGAGSNKTPKFQKLVSEKEKVGEIKPDRAVKEKVPAKEKTVGFNPLRVLTGKQKDEELNSIPTAKFEIDNS